MKIGVVIVPRNYNLVKHYIILLLLAKRTVEELVKTPIMLLVKTSTTVRIIL